MLPLTGVTTDSAALATPGVAAAASRSADQQVRAHVRLELQRLDVDRRDQHRFAVEPEVEVGERRERAHEQSRADEQHQRQRHLDDDEQVAEREAVLAGDPAALRLHRVVRFDARGPQRRDGTEDHGRRDRHAGA